MVDIDAVDTFIGWEAIGRFLESLRIDHRVDSFGGFGEITMRRITDTIDKEAISILSLRVA